MKMKTKKAKAKSKKSKNTKKAKIRVQEEENNDYKKVNCGPNPNTNDFTCYSNSALIKMRELWNARHSRNNITTNNPKEIWTQLRTNMSSSCDRESCWLRSKFMEGGLDNELLNYTFAPTSPRIWKTHEWLSSLDIESVMKQYEKYYKCFEFLGPSPIDFDVHKLYGECVWDELCKLNLSDIIKRNKNKIGIILNTDPHYKNGEHWISMFVNIKDKIIIYFDSNGNKPPKEVEKLIKKIVNQGKQLGFDFNVFINKMRHQKGNSECGMYSLYFIIQMLKGTNKDYFLKRRIPDEDVYKLRDEYFNGN
jgi:hypothetical protein